MSKKAPKTSIPTDGNIGAATENRRTEHRQVKFLSGIFNRLVRLGSKLVLRTRAWPVRIAANNGRKDEAVVLSSEPVITSKLSIHGRRPTMVASAFARQPVILLVTKHAEIRFEVTNYLESFNMHVVAVEKRELAICRLNNLCPSLIMLDLDPCRWDDLGVFRPIRVYCRIPIIVIGGVGCNEEYRTTALEFGADDCIPKPVGLRELASRIRAILRRQPAPHARPAQKPNEACYEFGGLTLDTRRRRLTNPSGELVKLSRGEYSLLVAFLEAPQRPLTRLVLMHALSKHEDRFDRSIDVSVARLRRRLEAYPGTARAIKTVRDVGYMFDLPTSLSV